MPARIQGDSAPGPFSALREKEGSGACGKRECGQGKTKSDQAILKRQNAKPDSWSLPGAIRTTIQSKHIFSEIDESVKSEFKLASYEFCATGSPESSFIYFLAVPARKSSSAAGRRRGSIRPNAPWPRANHPKLVSPLCGKAQAWRFGPYRFIGH